MVADSGLGAVAGGAGAAVADAAALDALWQSTRPSAQSLSSPSSSSSASSPSGRSQRALESGHVFVRHWLSGRELSSERVVLFVVGGVLYACRHTRHQSRYRQPFLSLSLSTACRARPVEVHMGKQSAALRLVPSAVAPERRCFSLRVDGVVLELEAPGSGDVRYWLRSLYELLTRTYSLAIAQSLVFLPPHTATAEEAERVEGRMRQLRMDGQRARRREEANRRLNGQQRLADERAREEQVRADEREWQLQHRTAAQQAAECRVALSALNGCSLSPSRVLIEQRDRLDGDRRMQASQQEARVEVERRRHLAVQPPQHAPALASEYAKLNQRCTALQTHMRAPLIALTAHTPTEANPAGWGDEHSNTGRRLGVSRWNSSPNLLASVPPVSSLSPSSPSSSSSSVAPPTCSTRSISGPSQLSAVPSQRRLACLKPHSHSQTRTLSQLTKAFSPLDSTYSSPTTLLQPLQPALSTRANAASSGQSTSSAHLSCSPVPSSALSTLISYPPSSSSFSAQSAVTVNSTALLEPARPSTSVHLSSSHVPPLDSHHPSFTGLEPNRLSSPSTPSSLSESPLSPFEPASPSAAHSFGSALYSPTRCLPMTAVYSVRTPSAAIDHHPDALSAALSTVSRLSAPTIGSNFAKNAAAMLEAEPPLWATPPALVSPAAVCTPSIASSAASSSIRFSCAIELPDLSAGAPACCPPHSRSPAASMAGGTHFHFHLHTSPPLSSSRPSHGNTAAATPTAWPPLPPPPPYAG